DLARIGRAHGRYFIGEDQSSFDKIHIAVKLEIRRSKETWIQIQQGPIRGRKNSLETKIVNREDRFRSSQFGISIRLGLEKDNGEGRLPVVTMDNSNRILAQDLQSGAAKKRVALGVVRVITLRGAVKGFPVKIPIVANQIDDNIVFYARLKNQPLLPPVRDRNKNFSAGILQRKTALEHRAIGRHDQAQFMSLPFKGSGEGTDHVGQTAGLGKGHNLGGYHANFHGNRIGLPIGCYFFRINRQAGFKTRPCRGASLFFALKKQDRQWRKN